MYIVSRELHSLPCISLTRMPMAVVVETPTELAVQVPDVTHPAGDVDQPCAGERVRTRSTRSCISSASDPSVTKIVIRDM